MKYKKFKHYPSMKVLPKMHPIKNVIPEFYKNKITSYTKNNVNKLPIAHNFKACSVYSDSFLVGYAIPLVCDIAVKQKEDGPEITWNDNSFTVLNRRPDTANNKELPTPVGFSDVHFAWMNHSIFEIPDGYSALYTHPLNRYDLPFITLSGIIDSFVMPTGQVPVYFSSTFEGIIPQGTPIAQVIFIKNENWKMVLDDSVLKIAEQNSFNSSSKAFGWYKQNIWKKKNYE